MEETRSCESVYSCDVRVGHSLNKAEMQHLATRRETALYCLKQHSIPCTEIEVPNIAVLGSGGGLRAMVGLLGSLSALQEEGLLDCIMYLCGVSGSTWCMASLYKERSWSTNLETLKDNIRTRLDRGSVSWWDKGHKLMEYTKKDNFTLTDVWAALVVSYVVREIDEHRLSEQRGIYTNDPYPIYTVIDKQCKHDQLNADIWFEITPDESGYSLPGAFVDSSCFGSQFEKVKKIKAQPEIDMLYLQGLCGSVFGDLKGVIEISKALKELIREMLEHIQNYHTSPTPDIEKGCQVLLTLVELNLCALRDEDPTVYLDDLLKDDEIGLMTLHLVEQMKSEGKISKEQLKDYILCVCNLITPMFEVQGSWEGICTAIIICIKKILDSIWGVTYNFVYGMSVEDIDASVLGSEKREYIDAGVLLNSPYFSVLRKERNIDLIISLDFSEGDYFQTVVQTAETCKYLKIPFPEVVVPFEEKEKPKDFYVFKDNTKAPTVIHVPLFNCVNCNGEIQEWVKQYCTFKMSYSEKMITDLLEKAGANIKNNKGKLLEEIKNIIKKKNSSDL